MITTGKSAVNQATELDDLINFIHFIHLRQNADRLDRELREALARARGKVRRAIQADVDVLSNILCGHIQIAKDQPLADRLLKARLSWWLR